MRNSTMILVVLVLAGASWLEREVVRNGPDRRHGSHSHAQKIRENTPELARARGRIEEVQKRLGSTCEAFRALEHSERAIDNLIRKAQRDRNHALRDQADRQIVDIYNRNLADLERRLAGIRSEKATLAVHRDGLEANKIGLEADLALKRIGNLRDDPAVTKPSPLEAIEKDVPKRSAPGCIVFEF